jgi:predicted DNA-binding transcriptional regulator AlpA
MPKNSDKKPRRMLTRREAAEELGVSQATLSRWAAERVGPAFVKYDDSRTGAVRYPREELDAYIASRLKSPKP